MNQWTNNNNDNIIQLRKEKKKNSIVMNVASLYNTSQCIIFVCNDKLH